MHVCFGYFQFRIILSWEWVEWTIMVVGLSKLSGCHGSRDKAQNTNKFNYIDNNNNNYQTLFFNL